MLSPSLSPELNPLDLGTDFTPLPEYKKAATTSVDFAGLLSTPLLIHEDLATGCGGQLWPAGMVLGTHLLRYHRNSLKHARILELGAGGGLVGLAVALGCPVEEPILISDMDIMSELMAKNVALNQVAARVQPAVLNWGEPLPAQVRQQRPNVILAADCVYFEPAFPLLLATLEDLLALCDEAVVYFCFKKRRRADLQFMKAARKKFLVEEMADDERPTFSREGLFLYTFRKKA